MTTTLEKYNHTGCATVVMEETELPITRANRLISRLHAACIAIDELLTETLGNDAEKFSEVCMLRAAILEAERYDPSSQEVTERIIAERF